MNSDLRIPRSLLTASQLSMTARMVYAQLLDHRNRKTGQCNPKQDTLAAELGVSVDTVQRAISKLRAAGLIQTAKGRRGCSYTFPEFPATAKARSTTPQKRGAGPPYPLYEPIEVNLRASRGFPSQDKNLSTRHPGAVRKPPGTEQVLAIYYAKQRRRAAEA